MALTTAQLPVLKAAILADSALSALPMDTDSAFFIAAELDKPATPDFTVWKSLVTQDEIYQNGMDWTRVDQLSVGRAREWGWMFDNANKAINPAKPNIRAGIEEVWKGTAADLAVRAAIYVHCKRLATRAEKLFATGTGTTETPATMLYEGKLSYSDVVAARALP